MVGVFNVFQCFYYLFFKFRLHRLFFIEVSDHKNFISPLFNCFPGSYNYLRRTSGTVSIFLSNEFANNINSLNSWLLPDHV